MAASLTSADSSCGKENELAILSVSKYLRNCWMRSPLSSAVCESIKLGRHGVLSFTTNVNHGLLSFSVAKFQSVIDTS